MPTVSSAALDAIGAARLARSVPEGDTLHRIAITLGEALGGQTLVDLAVAGVDDAAAFIGGRVRAVEARGKNLLIELEAPSGARATLHTHLMMSGEWRLIRATDRLPPATVGRTTLVRAYLQTPEARAVCVRAPVVRWLVGGRAAIDPQLARLGPDPLSRSFAVDEAVERLARCVDDPLGVALMRQSAIAGVGNVYKSELLFRCGLDPFARVDRFHRDELTKLVLELQQWMARNVRREPGRALGPRRFVEGMRRTREGQGERHFVYRRAGEPCLRCGEPIRMRRQGDMARSTYWCPRCQPRRAAERSVAGGDS